MSKGRWGGFKKGRKKFFEDWDNLKSASSISNAPETISDFHYTDGKGIWDLISTTQFSKKQYTSPVIPSDYTFGSYENNSVSSSANISSVDIGSPHEARSVIVVAGGSQTGTWDGFSSFTINGIDVSSNLVTVANGNPEYGVMVFGQITEESTASVSISWNGEMQEETALYAIPYYGRGILVDYASATSHSATVSYTAGDLIVGVGVRNNATMSNPGDWSFFNQVDVKTTDYLACGFRIAGSSGSSTFQIGSANAVGIAVFR